MDKQSRDEPDDESEDEDTLDFEYIEKVEWEQWHRKQSFQK